MVCLVKYANIYSNCPSETVFILPPYNNNKNFPFK